MLIDIPTIFENIDIDKDILEDIDRETIENIDIDKDILGNIDKGILENIYINIHIDKFQSRVFHDVRMKYRY